MQILAEAEDLPKTANIKTQLISLWTVPIFGGGTADRVPRVPGFFPPMSPDMSAEQVAAFYAENKAMVWFTHGHLQHVRHHAAPAVHGDRGPDEADGDAEPRLRLLYLTAAVSGATLFALANIFFLGGGVPSRAAIPSSCMLLNDLAWIIFIAPVGMTRRDEPAAGVRDLLRQRTQPGVSAVGRVLLRWPRRWPWRLRSAPQSSQTGPFAWDGVVSFWLRNGSFALFLLVMFFVLRTALQPPGRRGRRSRTDEQRGASPTVAIERRTRRLRTRRPGRASATSGSCTGSFPAFYTVVRCHLLSCFARVMPPPRPDVTTRSDRATSSTDHRTDDPDRVRADPGAHRRAGRRSPTGSSCTTCKRMTVGSAFSRTRYIGAHGASAPYRASSWWRSASSPRSSAPTAIPKLIAPALRPRACCPSSAHWAASPPPISPSLSRSSTTRTRSSRSGLPT